MAENKTRATTASVTGYLAAISDDDRRRDCKTLIKWMREITGEPPRMWGDSIVGFGSYHYKYDSGREGDFFISGLSSRKNDLAIYVMAGLGRFDSLLKKLGRHKVGKSCLYLKRLADVDREVLSDLVSDSVRWMGERYPDSD